MRSLINIIALLLCLSTYASDTTTVIPVDIMSERIAVYKDLNGIEKIGEIEKDNKVYLLTPGNDSYFFVYGAGLKGYSPKIFLYFNKYVVRALTNDSIEWKVNRAIEMDKTLLAQKRSEVIKDSLAKLATYKQNIRRINQQSIQLPNKVSEFDLSGCPIKILSYKIVTREYSNYRDIKISYKNISQKKVIGIRFAWEGVTVFGDKADMGSAINGYGGGFTDNEINAGSSNSGTWEILSRNAKKITQIYVTEVVYSDDKKWKKP